MRPGRPTHATQDRGFLSSPLSLFPTYPNPYFPSFSFSLPFPRPRRASPRARPPPRPAAVPSSRPPVRPAATPTVRLSARPTVFPLGRPPVRQPARPPVLLFGRSPVRPPARCSEHLSPVRLPARCSEHLSPGRPGPSRDTHLLQPLDFGLFWQLQPHYRKSVEDYSLTTNIGINRVLFFPIYKQARALSYNVANIASAFKKSVIVSFNARPVLSQLSPPTAASGAAARNHTEGFPLENTPYTKCEFRQQTNRALTFLKTANPREVSAHSPLLPHCRVHG